MCMKFCFKLALTASERHKMLWRWRNGLNTVFWMVFSIQSKMKVSWRWWTHWSSINIKNRHQHLKSKEGYSRWSLPESPGRCKRCGNFSWVVSKHFDWRFEHKAAKLVPHLLTEDKKGHHFLARNNMVVIPHPQYSPVISFSSQK